MSNKKLPPRLLLRFFRWFCHPDYVEDIEGDLLERFEKRKEAGKAARWFFVVDVLRLFRPGIIGFSSKTGNFHFFTLISHYLLVSKRILIRNRTYSLINIVGMGLSIGAALFILHYVKYEQNFDKFHNGYQDLYRISYSYFRGDQQERHLATTPPSIAPFLNDNMPEVTHAVRIYHYPWDLTVAFENAKYRENRVLFVEPEFLKIFNFPLVHGDTATCLSRIRTIVVTEKTAEKYFKDEDPVGKTVTLDGADVSYVITGVVEDPPSQSHIQFDFLVSYETIDWWWDGEAKVGWEVPEFYSYIRLNPKIDLELLRNKANMLVEQERGKANHERGISQQFGFQKVSSIHLNSNLENELYPDSQGDALEVNVLYIIGWLILIIAWINYVNLNTAKTIERAKTVGIRKTIGVQKWQLIGQFATEAFLLNVSATLVALLLLVCCIDYLNALGGSDVSLRFIDTVSFWAYVLFFWLGTSILSGVYSVYLLSSCKPIPLISNQLVVKRPVNSLNKVLIVGQFAISVALIAGTIIIYEQLDYMKSSDLGFEMTDVLIVKGPNQHPMTLILLLRISTARFLAN